MRRPSLPSSTRRVVEHHYLRVSSSIPFAAACVKTYLPPFVSSASSPGLPRVVFHFGSPPPPSPSIAIRNTYPPSPTSIRVNSLGGYPAPRGNDEALLSQVRASLNEMIATPCFRVETIPRCVGQELRAERLSGRLVGGQGARRKQRRLLGLLLVFVVAVGAAHTRMRQAYGRLCTSNTAARPVLPLSFSSSAHLLGAADAELGTPRPSSCGAARSVVRCYVFSTPLREFLRAMRVGSCCSDRFSVDWSLLGVCASSCSSRPRLHSVTPSLPDRAS